MPANRLLHKRAGAGERTNALTHLEFRAWIIYRLAADDFGVMRADISALIEAHPMLARVSARLLRAALERLVSSTLLGRFDAAGLTYVYSRDWQDFEKIEWPQVTTRPVPTPDVLAGCTPETQRLFAAWPGGKRVPPPPKFLASLSQERRDGVATQSLPRAKATAPATATATASGSENGDLGVIHQRGVLPRYDPSVHRWGRVNVMANQHAEFRMRLGNGDDAGERLGAFYAATEARWEADGTVPAGTPWQVWQRAFDAAFATSAGSAVAEANQAAGAAFLRGETS